jgi:NAD(P)-dependent dehydrogenase (short-subunit alcohol dehydrogenase family)
MVDLKGKVALVTGATSGIGQVTAEYLAGEVVGLHSNSFASASSLAEAESQTGIVAQLVVLGVSYMYQVSTLVQPTSAQCTTSSAGIIRQPFLWQRHAAKELAMAPAVHASAA